MKDDIFQNFSLHVRSIVEHTNEAKPEDMCFVAKNSKLQTFQYQIRSFYKLNSISLAKYHPKT